MESDGSLPVRIGTYRVLSRIATGGTSDVLLAQSEGPKAKGRTVVLKVLLQEFREDEQFERMFAAEAAAYARLSHPAIVELYDFFSDAEQLVMVLEYVDGMPLHKLRALLKRGKFLDDAAALFVGWRVFGALSAAHNAHDPETGALAPVIHRDVNPSNVLLPWDGQVKIADFGIAKVAGVDNDKTQAGFIKGTYGYMAPEQVRGETVTDRADVYAASLLLWELLVGRKAILRGGASDMDVLRSMAEPAFPSLGALRPELPLEVLDAVDRGLEKDPAKRTITAAEVAAALRLSFNLEDGTQRLVDAMTGVRPPAAPEDLAATVSRRPMPTIPDSAADMTIPNMLAVQPDATEVMPRAPAGSHVRTAPPRPVAQSPTLKISGAPPPKHPTVKMSGGAPPSSQQPTLMGISPVRVPPAVAAPPPPPPPAPPPPPPPPVVTRSQPPPPPVFAPVVTPAPLPAASRQSPTMPRISAAPPPHHHTGRIVAAISVLGMIAVVTVVLLLVWRAPSAYVPPPHEPSSRPSATTVATASVVPPPAPVPSAPPAAPPSASTATPTVVAAAPTGTTGTITVPESRGGHRVWVDNHIVGESPATFTVKCGWRAVQIGSQGQLHNVKVPCGGDVRVTW